MKSYRHPIAGRDYPETYQDFLEWFPDDQACRRYLERCSWPDSFVCASCGNASEPWTTGRGNLHCRLFYRLIEQAVATPPAPYQQILKENEIAGEHLR